MYNVHIVYKRMYNEKNYILKYANITVKRLNLF